MKFDRDRDDKLISKKKEYCKDAFAGSSLGTIVDACYVWQYADKTRYQMEFDAYLKGDEAEIRKDHNACYDNIKKLQAYSSRDFIGKKRSHHCEQ